MVGRRIADIVDRVDRTIGDPRVEDRQVKIKLTTGGQVTLQEGGGVQPKLIVGARLPLPSLERRSNLFLDVGGAATPSATELASPVVENVEKTGSAGLEYLSLTTWPVSFGVHLGMNYEAGPQGTIRPFVRWEKDLGPHRYYLTQEVFYKTKSGFGTRSYAHTDYVLGQEVGYFRFLSEAVWRLEGEGVNVTHGLLFRQPVGASAVLSYESGMLYNDARIDRGRYFLQMRYITKVWRPWIELELNPAAVYFWDGSSQDYSFTVKLNIIFEEFLRGGEIEAAPGANAPGAAP